MAICQGCNKSGTVREVCPHCKKTSKDKCDLRCPTCQKMDIKDSHFCCQACFKENWASHKETHKLKQQLAQAVTNLKPSAEQVAANHLNKFKNYEFTGALRPAEVTPQRTITDPEIALPDYAVGGIPHGEVKVRNSNNCPVHNAKQIAIMREACEIGRDALDLAGRMINSRSPEAPVTGDDIDTAVHEFIVAKKAYPSPLNYYNFPKSLCVSVNECICHGIPDKRPLQEGDIVNIDISVYHRGMHADLNETFIVGEADADTKRVVEGSYVCLMESIAQLKPGMMYREIGNIVQRTANEFKLSVVRSYCGHGVGQLFHCSPNVPHYAKNKAVGTLKPGHLFTIEPMINLGTYKDRTWPDDWTSVTVDGKKSAQFEHTLLVTEEGVEVLTARKPDSPSLGFDPEGVMARWAAKKKILGIK